jgi:hypothetical protein
MPEQFERYVRVHVPKNKDVAIFIIADRNGDTIADVELPKEVAKQVRDFLLEMYPLSKDTEDEEWQTVLEEN